MTSTKMATVQDRLQLLASQVGGPSSLAGLLGIHRGTLYDFLKGVRDVPKARLEKIAAMYPCNLEWLADGVGEAPNPNASRTLEAKAAAAAQKNSGQGIGGNATSGGSHPLRRTVLPALTSSVGRGRQVRLEAARERVLALLAMHEGGKVEEVLGSALYQEVKAGRACPSLALLAELAAALGVKPGWLLGLEE